MRYRDLFEDAIDISNGNVIWYDPHSGNYIQSKYESHGTFPFEKPEFFGMTKDEVSRLWDKCEDDVYAFLYDIISLTGYIRISLGFNGKIAISIQAGDLRSVRKGARWLVNNGIELPILAIECPGTDVYLRESSDISNFIRYGILPSAT